MTPSVSGPTRPIPARPNLEFDRKQAKTLLADLQAAVPEASERLTARHPRGAITPGEVKLSDAQLVIAREYGFPSWPQWKAFVETRGLERRRQAEIALKASCSSDLARARTLLNADPDLAREDAYIACATGEVDTVRAALAADTAWADRPGGVNGWRPLHYACFSRWLRVDPARTAGIIEIAKLLLAAGADVNASFGEDYGDGDIRQVPLYGAAGIANNAELTRLLLEAGADADDGYPPVDPAEQGKSPLGTESLYHAAEFADTTCLELLLARKPDPARVSYCMCRAIDFDDPRRVEVFLRAGADPNFGAEHLGGGNALHFALLRNVGLEVIRLLLAAGAEVGVRNAMGHTPYRRAVRMGKEDVAALLLEHGANPEDANEQDHLVGSLMRGRPVEPGRIERIPVQLLSNAVDNENLPAIEALLDAGVNVNGEGEGTMPPQHSAGWHGRLAPLKLLVERGADLNMKNSYGGNVLNCTIHGSENCIDLKGGPGMKLPEEAHPGKYLECVEYLISKGAPLPGFIWGGSAAVRELLRAHGVPDECP
jgi:ankyrin repeat protein